MQWIEIFLSTKLFHKFIKSEITIWVNPISNEIKSIKDEFRLAVLKYTKEYGVFVLFFLGYFSLFFAGIICVNDVELVKDIFYFFKG